MFSTRPLWTLLTFPIVMAFVITACTPATEPTIAPTSASTAAPTILPTIASTTAPTSPPTTAPQPTSVVQPTSVPPSASQPTIALAGTTVPGAWTTYTSPRYGYAVDYPTDWKLTPATRDWPSDYGTYPDGNAVDGWDAPTFDPWIMMFVLSVQLSKGESAADRIAKLDKDNAAACELGHRHDVTVDGVAARQEDGMCFQSDYISQIAVVHSGRFYFIYLLSGSPFSDTTLATFNRFVASFRFVGGP